MKIKAASLFLGICLAMLAVAATPAHARTVTAFGAFHAQSATVFTEDPYSCITEDNGAVVNNCTFPVNFYFDLPTDNVGAKTITVQDYWNGPSTFAPFNCVSYVYTGKTSSSIQGTGVTFTAPSQARNTTDSIPAGSGDTLTVICWEVPAGEGVAKLRWNQ